jgi:hypothetical protein
MNEQTGLLIALAIGVVLIASLFFFLIPEPSERAVVATERLDVAVLGLRNSSSWPGVEETLRGRIETKLVNESGISVYSRTQLDALLMERALTGTGMIDPTTAVEIGTLTGVSKLITGTVYGVDTRSDATTICVAWQDGNCVEEAAATRYSASILAQVEVIDTQTGRIEQSVDVSGADSATVREGNIFGGFDSLLASGADQIAGRVADTLTSTYTRELRYGLYRSAEPKRSGYVGHDPTLRFSVGEEAHLIVHFTRVQSSDTFDLSWIDPSGTAIETVEDVVSNGEWRDYTLSLEGLAPGRYHVQGEIAGTSAFDAPFSITE